MDVVIGGTSCSSCACGRCSCAASTRPASSGSPSGFQFMLVTSSTRAQVRLRAAVALEAPAHRQRRRLLDGRHLVDAAVAADAADALVHVDRVIEVDELGHLVDPVPLDRLVLDEALAHRLEERALVPDLRVAVQAELRLRDAGARRLDRPCCGSSGSRCPRHACGAGDRTASAARPDPACRARTACARRASGPGHAQRPRRRPRTDEICARVLCRGRKRGLILVAQHLVRTWVPRQQKFSRVVAQILLERRKYEQKVSAIVQDGQRTSLLGAGTVATDHGVG